MAKSETTNMSEGQLADLIIALSEALTERLDGLEEKLEERFEELDEVLRDRGLPGSSEDWNQRIVD